jgi:hypothetical protein
MKTSSLEHKDPDVCWLRVRIHVEVEFVVFSLSFELMFMNDKPSDMQQYYMLFGIFARDVGLYSLSVFYIA